MSIFHVRPGPFNQVDQVRFSLTFTKSITLRMQSKHVSTDNCKYTECIVNLAEHSLTVIIIT